MFTRPDNSVYKSNVISSDIDNAELAARLGINRIRRNGRVVFYDDFGDSGLAWELVETAPDGVCRVYTEHNSRYPFTPPGMLLMLPGGSTPQYSSYATANFPLAAVHSMGLEVTFKLFSPGSTFLEYLKFELSAGGKQARLRINNVNNYVQIQNRAGTWINIVSVTGFNIWNNIKLVIDTDTGTYNTLFIERDKYDLTDLLPTGSFAGSFSISALDDTNKIYGTYIDNVIITTEESLR